MLDERYVFSVRSSAGSLSAQFVVGFYPIYAHDESFTRRLIEFSFTCEWYGQLQPDSPNGRGIFTKRMTHTFIKTVKRYVLITTIMAFSACLGCNREAGSFQGHTLGESFAQFAAKEHPQTQIPPGVAYTGTIHCFDTQTLGDQCKGPRNDFDNAHFTFVDDKLVGIETVGAGGIIGDSHQNWNWNLYLSQLTKQYGKPNKMAASDALWTRHSYIVHAYLTVAPMPYSTTGEESQEEHIEVLSRSLYDQAKK